MEDTANSIFGDIHNSTIIQARDIVHAGPRQKVYDEPWQRMVARAEVWQHTSPGRDAGQDAVEAAGRLAALRVDIREDPWLDRGFVERFDQRIGGLVKHRLRLRLAPAEATLLALVPVLHQVLWTRAAAGACGGRPEVDPAFQRDHVRLLDLADRRPDADAVIRWWLFHRWLSLRVEVVRPESVHELLAEAEFPGYLRPEWVQALLYALRLEPGVLCTDWVRRFRSHEPLFGGTPDEQQVRLPLLGLVLSVAHAMAIEATDLSETVVWHVGVPRPVELQELHGTLATAQWDNTTLVATCHHAAVVESLSEHLARVNTLLHEVSKAAHRDQGLEPLRALPERVNGDGVVAATGPDGKPVFTGWNRFNLDEQRVQELLMGEQLYRDRGLAVRELYQNALDACRYRRAREEYLFRTTGRKTDWVGGIRFEQDVDESGRPYLDCVDNGVGMGISELTGVFSRAGARFADLTEFRDEQADWERLDPPVELFPNSRFGIGVLSYFMLADEITITTCRMDRTTGLPGPVLQVTIVGPGHLFHIQKVSDRGEPGTRVRLHLRSGSTTSCVAVLKQLLEIAEFATTARHGEKRTRWRAGELRVREIHDVDEVGYGGTVANAEGTVVWCEHGGAVLVDGLRARPAIRTGVLHSISESPSYDLRGAVVNLTGRASPRLSIDRTEILDDISMEVERLLSAAIPALVQSSTTFLNRYWLGAVTARISGLADLILDQWPTVRTFFPPDETLFPKAADAEVDSFSVEQFHISLNTIPDSVLLWRLLALAPHRTLDELVSIAPELGEVASVLDARPSDLILLTKEDISITWCEAERLITPGHVFSAAARAGLTPRATAQRLVALGFTEVTPACYPDHIQNFDTELALLQYPWHSTGQWLSPNERLPVDHISTASENLRISPHEARDILAGYGFAAPPTTEELLRSRNLDGRRPWLAPDEPVTVGHIVKAAGIRNTSIEEVRSWLHQLDLESVPFRWNSFDDSLAGRFRGLCDELDDLDIGDIAAIAHTFNATMTKTSQWLQRLGFDIPAVPTSPPRPDQRIISRDLNGVRPWLRRNSPVPPHHFLRAQWKYGMTPERVADQLRELGYEPVLCEQQPEDVILLGGTGGGYPVIDPYEPVTLGRLVAAGRRLSMPVTRVAARLRTLGIDVPDLGDMVRSALAKVPRSHD